VLGHGSGTRQAGLDPLDGHAALVFGERTGDVIEQLAARRAGADVLLIEIRSKAQF
jgi:hypothetical protein